MTRFKKMAVRSAAAGLGLFLLLQFVPYGRSHSNPPLAGSPNWDLPQTEALARRACFDCHSNETQWPWYSSVAPLSWRIQHHVDEGRSKLNFSEFDQPQKDAHEAAKEVREGKMPLGDYVLAHPESRLSPGEKQELVRGLRATFGDEDRAGGEDQDEH